MYAKVTSLGVTGLPGYIVQVEADLSGGLPQINLVGPLSYTNLTRPRASLCTSRWQP